MFLYCVDKEYADFLTACGFPLIKKINSSDKQLFIFSNKWSLLTHPKDKVVITDMMTF